MIKIRKAKNSDVDIISKISDDIFKVNINYDQDYDINWSKKHDSRGYFKSLLSLKSSMFLIALDENKIIGYIIAAEKVVDERKGKFLEVIDLGVVSDYQNKGVGKLLLKKVVSWSKQNCFTSVILNVYSKNIRAIEFYKRLGFNELDLNLELKI